MGTRMLGGEQAVTAFLGRRVVSSGSAVWTTPKGMVASMTFMGGSCGPRMGTAALFLSGPQTLQGAR